jgi:hypothetical protein
MPSENRRSASTWICSCGCRERRSKSLQQYAEMLLLDLVLRLVCEALDLAVEVRELLDEAGRGPHIGRLVRLVPKQDRVGSGSQSRGQGPSSRAGLRNRRAAEGWPRSLACWGFRMGARSRSAWRGCARRRRAHDGVRIVAYSRDGDQSFQVKVIIVPSSPQRLDRTAANPRARRMPLGFGNAPPSLRLMAQYGGSVHGALCGQCAIASRRSHCWR